jgi:hypothetical protein
VLTLPVFSVVTDVMFNGSSTSGTVIKERNINTENTGNVNTTCFKSSQMTQNTRVMLTQHVLKDINDTENTGNVSTTCFKWSQMTQKTRVKLAQHVLKVLK